MNTEQQTPPAQGAASAGVVQEMHGGSSRPSSAPRPRRAPATAAECGAPTRAVAWAERAAALDGAALVVNATSLGMEGKPPLELALGALAPDAVVYDIVYVPLETPLLAAARARGNPAVDGLGMLLHQARPGFRAWFGTMPAVDSALRAHVLADL